MKLLEHWLPGEGFGAPRACLATTFTFDSDFFTEDCLSRFLSVSTRDPDGASGLDIAGLLEEEEKLAEAQVCVLVDQSCRPEPRNLRWDLVPVRVPGGLLHAKVVVLVWEKAARIIIGSANLTRAGYRQQVELAMSIDLDDGCAVPRQVFDDLSAELRSLIRLADGDPERPGPLKRALSILGLLDARIARLDLPTNGRDGLRFAIAAAGPRVNPLDKLVAVWSGTPPQAVTALSPFWDEQESMPGARAVLGRLAKRASTGERTKATFVVPVDASAATRIVRAPRQLQGIADPRIKANVHAFAPNGDRRLHAKCVQYRSNTWVATMIGSSNLTAKGLGLEATSHRELNLWIGCSLRNPHAKALCKLIPVGDEVDAGLDWSPAEDDEDEAALHPLPSGFGEALLTGPTTIELAFTGKPLPADWKVSLGVTGPGGSNVFGAEAWKAAGRPLRHVLRLPDDVASLPSLLEVSWRHGGELRSAVWLVNVGDDTALPPPAELRSLPADVLLAILASTRPLRMAIEDAIRTRSEADKVSKDELDPLKRFDSSRLLIQRTRRVSAALWGIERRLSQRIHGLESLEWRLAGILGPEHLARKLVEAEHEPGTLVGESLFLLAELALTIRRIQWHEMVGDLPIEAVMGRVQQTVEVVRDAAEELRRAQPATPLDAYLQSVFSEDGL